MKFPQFVIINFSESFDVYKDAGVALQAIERLDILKQCIDSFVIPACNLQQKLKGCEYYPALRLKTQLVIQMGFAAYDKVQLLWPRFHDNVAKQLLIYGGLDVEKANGVFNYTLLSMLNYNATLGYVPLLPYKSKS